MKAQREYDKPLSPVSGCDQVPCRRSMNFFQAEYAATPSILTSFIVLTVPVILTIVAVTYLLQTTASREPCPGALVEHFRNAALDSMRRAISIPCRRWSRSPPRIGDEFPDFDFIGRSFEYLNSLLVHSDTIVSVYVGLKDGTFRQARRIDPQVKIFGNLPPKENSRFAYRWVLEAEDGKLIDRYQFRDAEGRVLGVAEQSTIRSAHSGLVPTHDRSPRHLCDGSRCLLEHSVYRIHDRGTVLCRRQTAGRGSHRHHSRWSVGLPGRAQDQPRNAELHSRFARTGYCKLQPVQNLCQQERAGRAAARDGDGRRLACSGHRGASTRSHNLLFILSERSGVCRKPVRRAARARQALATFHYRTAIRFHGRPAAEQRTHAVVWPCDHGPAVRDRLSPRRRGLSASREARGEGQSHQGVRRGEPAEQTLADP